MEIQRETLRELQYLQEDIAAYSKRIVRLKDGLISSDKKN